MSDSRSRITRIELPDGTPVWARISGAEELTGPSSGGGPTYTAGGVTFVADYSSGDAILVVSSVPLPPNTPPTISVIEDQTVEQDGVIEGIAFTVDDETVEELPTEAKDAFVWEGGVLDSLELVLLDSLELVLLEERRVEMIGVVENSLVVQVDGILVFVLDDSSDEEYQTVEADVVSHIDDRRLSFLLVFIADRAYLRILGDGRGGRHGGCCWLFTSCCV